MLKMWPGNDRGNQTGDIYFLHIVLGKVTDQYKLRCAVNTFKPFKSAGTDETVPSILQQVLEYLMSYLFRACLAEDMYH